MATNYGPRIVTDGLIVNLDASVNASYPFDKMPLKSNLILWLDASDDSVFSYSSGTAVTQWRDKSGFNNHVQASASYTPLRSSSTNGKSVLVFSSSFLTTSTNILKAYTDYTKIAVVKQTNAGTAGNIIGKSTGANTTFWYGSSNNIKLYHNANTILTSSIATSLNTWNILSGTFDSTNLNANIYVNGSSGGSATSPTVTQITTDSDVEIGGYGGAGNYFTGEIAEILIFNKVLSASELKQVHTYLGQKWNIANNDKTFFDLSGNGNHAALVNNPRYDENNKGKFYFNKVNTNYCTIPNNIQLSGALNNEFSLCFYLQNTSPASDNSTNYGIFYKANPSTFTTGSAWFYKNGLGGGYNYLFVDESGNTKATVGFAADNADGSGGDVINQYVISHDSSNYYGYKNGSLITSGALGSSLGLNNSSDIYIGQSNITSSPFLGNLYAFQMYNRALSSSEVSQNYEASKTKYLNSFCEKSLILSWDANNSLSYPGTGVNVFDLSPVGNHCDLFRGAAFVDDGELKYFSMNGTGACVRRSGQLSQWTPNGGYATVCVWFRPSGIVGGDQRIFSDNFMEHGIRQSNATVRGYFLQDTSSRSITANNWYYACLVGSGTAAGVTGPFYNEFYVNGNFISSGVTTQNNNGMNDNPYGFGADIGYTGLYAFSGDIASAQLYNRRLTQDEIIANYNATKSVFDL